MLLGNAYGTHPYPNTPRTWHRPHHRARRENNNPARSSSSSFSPHDLSLSGCQGPTFEAQQPIRDSCATPSLLDPDFVSPARKAASVIRLVHLKLTNCLPDPSSPSQTNLGQNDSKYSDTSSREARNAAASANPSVLFFFSPPLPIVASLARPVSRPDIVSNPD